MMVDVQQFEGYVRAERGADGLVGLQYLVNFGDPRCKRKAFGVHTRQPVIDPQVQTFVVNEREFQALHAARLRAGQPQGDTK